MIKRIALIRAITIVMIVGSSMQHLCAEEGLPRVVQRDPTLVDEHYRINREHSEAKRIFAAVKRENLNEIADLFATGVCGICLYTTQDHYLIEFVTNDETSTKEPGEVVIFETETVLVLSKTSDWTGLTSMWHLARTPKVFLGATVPFGDCNIFLPPRYRRSGVERDDLGPDVEMREE